MAVFFGTFENKVDRKGRVSVPASFRQQLASSSYSGIIARPSHKHNAIEACGYELMQDLNDSIEQSPLYSEAHEDLSFSIFTESAMVPFDGEGRVILPAHLIEHAGISDRASFAGFGSSFLIFEPQTLARKKTESRNRAQQNGLTLKLNRGLGGPS